MVFISVKRGDKQRPRILRCRRALNIHFFPQLHLLSVRLESAAVTVLVKAILIKIQRSVVAMSKTRLTCSGVVVK